MTEGSGIDALRRALAAAAAEAIGAEARAAAAEAKASKAEAKATEAEARAAVAAAKVSDAEAEIAFLKLAIEKLRRELTGRAWVYVRDDRPFGGPDPPAVLFRYSRDRSGEHPVEHLKTFAGIFQADIYSGYNALYVGGRSPGPIAEAACWAHSRRKFFELADIAASARRGKNAPPISPLALEAVKRIDVLFDIERGINGETAEHRLAVRQELSAPVLADLKDWMETERGKLSKHAPVAKAMDYMLRRWALFARFLDDGRICLTNNAAERALRGIATMESFCTPSSSV